MEVNTAKQNFFEVEKGSNYEVTLTYGKIEIVEFEQFQKIATAIFKGQGDFVTVNKIIVQKKDIRMISPTKQLTTKQEKDRESRESNKALKKAQQEKINAEQTKFKVQFFDTKYGKGNWSNFKLSSTDIIECMEAYHEQAKQYYLK